MINILGQSGKFTVYNEGKGEGSGIQVIMDALREVDSSGSAVGASGSVKHSINTFAAQNFAFTHNETVTIYGLTASKVSFQSEVSSIGFVTVDTYIFQEGGLVGPPGEQWSVGCGDLKWNINFSSWSWCGCSQGQSQETGAYIDLDVSVRGQGNIQAKAGSARSLELGGGMTCELSSQVQVDGNWTQMPSGYPMISTQGSTTTFTFRFPKFADFALYDPVITGVSPADTTTTAPPAPTTTEVDDIAGAGVVTTTAVGGAPTTTAVAGAATTTAAGGAPTTTAVAGAATTTAAGGAPTTTAAGGAGVATTTVVDGSPTTTAVGGTGAATTTVLGSAPTTTAAGGSVATTTMAGAVATTTAAGAVATTTVVAGGAPTTTVVGGAPTTTAADAAVMTTTPGAVWTGGAETTTTAGGATTPSPECPSSRTMIDILGESGKFTVYNEAKGSGRGIQVVMDALREVDAKGNAVGSSGKEKHSIQTFAAQNFQFSQQETVTVYNLKASKVSFHSEVSSIGVLTVDTYIFQESGLAGPPGEQWSVGCGDLKWNIRLSNWTWCGCAAGNTEEFGEYVDLDISVKGQANIQMKKGSNRSLELGDGMTCELSNQVEVDTKWSQMPAGYPMISTKGSSTTFTFRFPKFTDFALYDPLITGVSPPDTTTMGATTPATTYTTAASGTTTTTAVADGATTTIPIGGATTTAPAGGATTTAPAGGATTTVPAGGATTTVPVGGATTTALTTTMTVPLAKVEGSLDLSVSDCTAFSAQQNVTDSLSEGIAAAAGSGISKGDIAVTIACSRRLGASRRLSGTTATVNYVITVPAAAPTSGGAAPVAPTAVADNIASETLTTFTAKITQALQSNGVPAAGVTVAAVVAPTVVLPPTTTTLPAEEPTGAGSRGSASPALAAVACLLAAAALA